MHSSKKKKVDSLKFLVKKISAVEEGKKVYEAIPEKLQQNPDGHCKYNYTANIIILAF